MKTDLFTSFRSKFNFCYFSLSWLILLANSNFDFNTVFTRKKRQQIMRFHSQLSESDADFMVGQSNHDAQTEKRASASGSGTFLNNTNNATQVKGTQVAMHTLEEDIVSKVRCRAYTVMKMVESRVQDTVLTAKDKLEIPRVELAMS